MITKMLGPTTRIWLEERIVPFNFAWDSVQCHPMTDMQGDDSEESDWEHELGELIVTGERVKKKRVMANNLNDDDNVVWYNLVYREYSTPVFRHMYRPV